MTDRLADSPSRHRARWMLVLATLVALLSAGIAPIAASASNTASISGTVTDELGAPVGFAYVTAYADGNFVAGTNASASGEYLIDGLAPGTYTLNFQSGGNFLGEWWDDQPSQTLATTFVVADGASVVGKDAVLAIGSTISGTVSDASGNPIPLASVSANRSDGRYGGSAITSPSGDYVITGLAAGSYTLVTDTFAAPGYVREWWDDQPTQELADFFPVPARSEITGKDVVLTLGSVMSGTVTGPSGEPISGVEVVVVDSNMQFVSGATSTADGTYAVRRLPAGTYALQFRPGYGQNYLSEWWNDSSTFTLSDSIEVAAQAEVTGLDAVLSSGATVSGTVTAASGLPLAGATVSASSTECCIYGGATTDSNGQYTIVGLPAGTYTVNVSAPFGLNYARQTLPAFPIAAAEAVSGKDAVLVVGGTISGTVTDDQSDPVSSVSVDVLGDDYGFTASTDASGQYTVVGLPTGSYRVQFRSTSRNLATEWWNDVYSRVDATSIAVTAGGDITGIDAALELGATISGTVRGPGNAPVSSGSVAVVSREPGVEASYSYSGIDENGSYLLQGLPPGEYTLTFSSSGLGQRWWGGTNSLALATFFAVGASEAVTGKDITLPGGSTITGVIRDALDRPVNNATNPALGATVRVFDAEAPTVSSESVVSYASNYLGAYSVGQLAPGTYLVQFGTWRTPESDGIDPTSEYVHEWFNESPDVAGATVITITAGGQVVTGVDGWLYRRLAGVGSAQTQDVTSGLGSLLTYVASADSSGTETLVTRTGGSAFPRPSDSVEAQVALSAEITSGTLGGVPMTGALDFARSTIGPSAAFPGTELTFIPFARDAVTFAVNAASDFPRDIALGAPSQDSLVPAPFTLRNIYRGVTMSYVDTNLDTIPITPLLPPVGSEIRAFWLERLGLSEGDLSAAVVDLASDTPEGSATDVETAGDLLPISISSYLAQGNHASLPTDVAERRGITELGNIDTTSPFQGGAAGLTVNPSFPVTRLVYTAVETSRLTSPSVDDVTLQKAFAGTGSELCSAAALIRQYGYATIGSLCGDTTTYRQGLRPVE